MRYILMIVGFLSLTATDGEAGDIEAGAQRAQSCAVCHGKHGMSQRSDIPNLACQPAEYLIKALNDYRSGAREDKAMEKMARGLRNQEIENLAAYYAAMRCPVK